MESMAWYQKMIVILVILPFFVLGCKDSTGPEVEQGPPPPAFNISSLQTTLVGGDPGILFRASSNNRVRLVQVVVRNPNNNSISYSPQGLIVQANEIFDLQAAGTAFFRWSGNWQFTFVGNHEPGGQSFEVVQTMSVSAKERP